MNYSKEEVMQYVEEEDVKFIRLAFCDVTGKQKNISIMPEELPRAFEYGISFDASAIEGFGDEAHSDLLLHPDPDTLAVLPWRPEHGRVVRMFSSITDSQGNPFAADTRQLLKKAVADAQKEGYTFTFGAEQEFYLFQLDASGRPTKVPYDNAGYMDIAPDDRGENIRREICLTLWQMGIRPESSHHEEGPGQNEIDFAFSDPLTAADQTLTLHNVVKTTAARNGLFADFSAKPLAAKPGNGFHINMAVYPAEGDTTFSRMIAGILTRAPEMMAFLNPTENSYIRFGEHKAPGYVSWARENRSVLVRVPAASGRYRRAELRSPDPSANPYLAFALLIYAALDGIRNNLPLPDETAYNLFTAGPEKLETLTRLPGTLAEAKQAAAKSELIRTCLPAAIREYYL